MEKENKYWLNDHGLRYWTNKNDNKLFAMRSYHWCDRVSFIDESEGGREYVGETTFTKFLEVEENWHPMSKKQYDTLIAKHREENKEFYSKLEK